MAKKKSKKTTAARTKKKTSTAKAGSAGKVKKKKATTKAAGGKTAAKPKAKSPAKTRTVKAAGTGASKSRGAAKSARGGGRSPGAPTSNGHIHASSHARGNGSLTASRDHFAGRQPLSEADLRAVKTGLTRKDLNHFRAVLLEKRAEIFGDVQGMQDARNSANGGDVSHMPLHMADVGSDNYEQEFTLGLMESERRVIVEIDEALTRIQSGTYGVCIESGQPIPRQRLEIKPWAKYTIEVARERERRGLL